LVDYLRRTKVKRVGGTVSVDLWISYPSSIVRHLATFGILLRSGGFTPIRTSLYSIAGIPCSGVSKGKLSTRLGMPVVAKVSQ
jgi:hypothetical protein